MAQPGAGGGASVDHGREPCPDRILDDIGGAFGMGAVGGGVWNLFKGMRNAPRGSRMFGGVEVSLSGCHTIQHKCWRFALLLSSLIEDWNQQLIQRVNMAAGYQKRSSQDWRKLCSLGWSVFNIRLHIGGFEEKGVLFAAFAIRVIVAGMHDFWLHLMVHPHHVRIAECERLACHDHLSQRLEIQQRMTCLRCHDTLPFFFWEICIPCKPWSPNCMQSSYIDNMQQPMGLCCIMRLLISTGTNHYK